MAVSPIMLNGTQNTPVLRSSGIREINQNIERIKQDYARFNSDYINKRNLLLECLNNILKVNGQNKYSFGANGLPIETIFNENSFANDKTICNAGKKAYAYYLKEVLQKLNLLNQHILKGQEALSALDGCTNEGQIKNYETILEIQDGLVKKYLDDFNKYTVVQTLSTTRITVRNKITGGVDKKWNDKPLVEINYAIKGKIWNEDGTETGKFNTALRNLDELDALRRLTTEKETGFQYITTTLINKHTGNVTNLNDPFGFNVVAKDIPENSIIKETTPIALFDELTLLEKLKYIRVYYTQNTNPYHYPEDLKSGVPCMSRDELKNYIKDTNKLQNELRIEPTAENAPKTDPVEPGAIELFYIGYLEDSQGAINALASFMEVKSVSMLAQIEQQSYRIKALKTYLKMLEIALQELNKSYEGDKIATYEGKETYTKAYLAIKYAAANQTRTLVNINGSDYIVLQCDDGQYEHYNISKNKAYIYVKATEEGIKEFLKLQWDAVDTSFEKLANNYKEFSALSDGEIKKAYDNGTIYEGGTTYENKIYDYFYTTVKMGNAYKITTDGNHYRYDGISKVFISTGAKWVYKKDINLSIQRGIENKNLAYKHYDNIIYQKQNIREGKKLESTTGNILFAKFDNNDQAIKELPKELETAKVSMNSILTDNYGGVGMSWKNKNDKENKYKNQWRKLVDQWQNICQTAIENIGSQIESVNKTIKSLRSKIDTFDTSANRFRDKFYSTIMTTLNKIS